MSANPFAFPAPSGATAGGMTLRDWFAGQALSSIMPDFGDAQAAALACAAQCYAFADAMLVEREKQP